MHQKILYPHTLFHDVSHVVAYLLLNDQRNIGSFACRRISRKLIKSYLGKTIYKKMGGGASNEQANMSAVYAKRSTLKEVVAIMMPIYYTDALVTPEDFVLASANWDMILNDQSPVYLELKKSRFEYSSCVVFFYETFYARLFDVHPVSKTFSNQAVFL